MADNFINRRNERLSNKATDKAQRGKLAFIFRSSPHHTLNGMALIANIWRAFTDGRVVYGVASDC